MSHSVHEKRKEGDFEKQPTRCGAGRVLGVLPKAAFGLHDSSP